MKSRPIADRLREKVDRSSGPDACWPFTGTLKDGYGKLSLGGRGERRFAVASRVAWEEANGPIPDGLFVCHHCDYRACCNPAHLFLGSHAANMEDMRSKGRGSNGDARGERNARAVLSEADVTEMRAQSARGVRPADIAVQFGVSYQHAWSVVRGRRWQHVKERQHVEAGS